MSDHRRGRPQPYRPDRRGYPRRVSIEPPPAITDRRGRRPISWGLGDFFLAYFASLVLASVVGLALLGTGIELQLRCVADERASTGPAETTATTVTTATTATTATTTTTREVTRTAPGCPSGTVLDFDGEETLSVEATFGAVIGAQALGAVGALVVISRWKGQRSLRRDFGFELRPRDWPYLFFGLASTIAIGLAFAPLIRMIDDNEDQPLVDLLSYVDTPLELLLAFLGVVILAPAIEELLFRGVLLRSLQRRLPDAGAIVLQASVFSLAHALGNVGGGVNAVVQLAILAIFGLVLGTVAVRSGSASRPILLHAGFNLLGLLQGL